MFCAPNARIMTEESKNFTPKNQVRSYRIDFFAPEIAGPYKITEIVRGSGLWGLSSIGLILVV